jgi:aerobic carbon-monoxide dehydrogenase medium subunit
MLPKFDVLQPKSLQEACALLQEHGPQGVAVLGGGTDLLVNLRVPIIPEHLPRGKHSRPLPKAIEKIPAWLLALSRIPELRGITEAEGHIAIGAMTTLTEVAASPLVREKLSALAGGADNLGSPLVRNRGTLGGNLCNARPAADTLIATVALSGQLELHSVRGVRTVPAEDFARAPGKTVIAPDEILARIIYPIPTGKSGSAFYKLANRKALEIAVVNVASALTLDEKGKISQARIALGAVAPTPILAVKAAQSLIGQKPSAKLFAEAGKIAATECKPITDHRGSAEYRVDMVEVLVRRVLGNCLNR